MTRITYNRTEDRFCIRAEGHAGYAKVGEDIVCAAVSVLLQTLAYRVMDLTLDYNFEINNGYFYLDAVGKDCLDGFNTILVGLEMLESEYPNHVSLRGGCPIFPKEKL